MSELKRELYPKPDLVEEDSNEAAPEGRRLRPKGRRDRQRLDRQGRKRRRRRLTLSVLPTLLTLGNGVCGLAAIAGAPS